MRDARFVRTASVTSWRISGIVAARTNDSGGRSAYLSRNRWSTPLSSGGPSSHDREPRILGESRGLRITGSIPLRTSKALDGLETSGKVAERHICGRLQQHGDGSQGGELGFEPCDCLSSQSAKSFADIFDCLPSDPRTLPRSMN